MATANDILMDRAKESLKGKWRLAIKVSVIYFVIEVVIRVVPILGGIAAVIVAGPFMVGLASFWLAFSRNDASVNFHQMFSGFDQWVRAMQTYLWMMLFIFLRFLLLIIPGIIAGFAYSQVFFILAEDPTIEPRDALRKSKEMMQGYKWKLFRLHLAFFGWLLLSILTLGIGLLWLMPYIEVTMAKFYDDIKIPTAEATPVPEVVVTTQPVSEIAPVV